MAELSGYVFETLHDDGEFVLRPTGMENLPTLMLAPASDQTALENLQHLEREYLLRDGLDSPERFGLMLLLTITGDRDLQPKRKSRQLTEAENENNALV